MGTRIASEPVCGREGSRSSGRRRAIALLALTVCALWVVSWLVRPSTARADTIPALVSIGNGPTASDGTYFNAQELADNLVFTNLVVQASARITVVDPVDLGTSSFGTPFFNLTLTAPVCNISNHFNFAQFGRLFLTCGTLNFADTITSGAALIAPNRVVSTATQANVQTNTARIQQAIDDSSPSSPVTVNVAHGHYAENLNIGHALTLHGDDGTAASGAGPDAPVLVGTQAGAANITITADNVTADGLHLSGVVNDSPATRSLNGLKATGVETVTVAHNTFEGFSGPAIQTAGSTNVITTANDITPTLLGTAVTPADPSLAAGTDQQLTATGSYSQGPDADLTGTATWTSSDQAVATVDTAGLAHAVSPGTATITATIGAVTATTNVLVGPANSQTITFTSTPPEAAGVGQTYLVSASASSELPVSFSIDPSSSPGACTLAGTTVTFTAIGSCVIDANQPGNGIYPPAPQAAQSLTIGKGSQTITFTSTPPADVAIGEQYLISATASSGLPVTFAIGSTSTAGACTRTGATVSITGTGTCVINANQSGDLNYLPAPKVQQILTVSPAAQPPTFTQANPPPTAFTGAGYLYVLAATGNPTPSLSLAPGAPSWLFLDPDSGLLTGTPPVGIASFTFSVLANNPNGQASAGPFTVTTSPPPSAAQRANLALSLTCPATVKVKITLKCKAVTTNHGPATAINYQAVVVLPASFTALSPSAGAAVYGRQILWAGGSLASGASVTFTVTAKATTAGTYTTTGATWSQTADPKPLNNSREKVETITGRN